MLKFHLSSPARPLRTNRRRGGKNVEHSLARSGARRFSRNGLFLRILRSSPERQKVASITRMLVYACATFRSNSFWLGFSRCCPCTCRQTLCPCESSGKGHGALPYHGGAHASRSVRRGKELLRTHRHRDYRLFPLPSWRPWSRAW